MAQGGPRQCDISISLPSRPNSALAVPLPKVCKRKPSSFSFFVVSSQCLCVSLGPRADASRREDESRRKSVVGRARDVWMWESHSRKERQNQVHGGSEMASKWQTKNRTTSSTARADHGSGSGTRRMTSVCVVHIGRNGRRGIGREGVGFARCWGRGGVEESEKEYFAGLVGLVRQCFGLYRTLRPLFWAAFFHFVSQKKSLFPPACVASCALFADATTQATCPPHSPTGSPTLGIT